MDKFLSSDEEADGFDADLEDGWEDASFIRRLTEDLSDAYVKPIEADVQARHLAAMAQAMEENLKKATPLSLSRQDAASRSWSASGPSLPSTGRVVPRSPSAGLSSPFGARRTDPPAFTAPARPQSPAPVRPSIPAPVRPAIPVAGVASLDAKRRSKLHPVELLNSMSSKAAAVVALIGLSSFGLAVAGQLPKPVQTAFSEAGDHIGLEIPAPIVAPNQATPAPDRKQPVVVPPPVVLPQPAAVPSPQAVPSYQPAQQPPAASSASTPAPVAPQPLPSVAPAAADFQNWLNELIRQALETSNMRATQQSSGTVKPQSTGSTPAKSGTSTTTGSSTPSSTQQYPQGTSSGTRSGQSPRATGSTYSYN